jgi:menaquinone-dependent protoporphyrinogen oxidase
MQGTDQRMSTPDKPEDAAGADVLVAFASKMGGTAGIAEMIAEELRAHGLRVDVMPTADVDAIGGYRAVVLGSGLYMRRWRAEAVRFLRRHQGELRGTRVWLFQSGPCGPAAAEPAAPEPGAVRRLRSRADIEAPETFGGRLDPASARGWLARRMASGELAGDFRDPLRIRRWAAGIAAALGR